MEEEDVHNEKVLSPEPFPLRKKTEEEDYSDDSKDQKSIHIVSLPQPLIKLKKSSSAEMEDVKPLMNENKNESEKREKIGNDQGLTLEESLLFKKKKKNFDEIENLTIEKEEKKFAVPKIPMIRNGKIPKFKANKNTMMMTNFFDRENQSNINDEKKKKISKSSRERETNSKNTVEEKTSKKFIPSDTIPMNNNIKKNDNKIKETKGNENILSVVKSKNLPKDFTDSMTIDLLDQRKLIKQNKAQVKDEELLEFLRNNQDKLPNPLTSRITSLKKNESTRNTSQRNISSQHRIKTSESQKLRSSQNEKSINQSQEKEQNISQENKIQSTNSQKRMSSKKQNEINDKELENQNPDEEKDIENEQEEEEEEEHDEEEGENVDGAEEDEEMVEEEEEEEKNKSYKSNSRKRKTSSSLKSSSSSDEEKELERMREKKKYLEDIQSRLAEQEKREKKELIYEFWKMEKNGIPVSKKWTQEDNIFEMRFEYYKLRSETNLQEKVRFIWNLFTMFNGIAQLANEKLNPFGISMDGWTETLEQDKNDYEALLRKMYKQISHKWVLKPHIQFLMMFGGQFINFIGPRIFKKFGDDKNVEMKQQKTLKESKDQDDIEQLKKKMEEMSTNMVTIVSQMEIQQTKNLEIQMQMLTCLSQISNNMSSSSVDNRSTSSSPAKKSPLKEEKVQKSEKLPPQNPLSLKIPPIDISKPISESTKKDVLNLISNSVSNSVQKGLKMPSYSIEPPKDDNHNLQDVGHLLNIFQKFSEKNTETPKEFREYESEPEKPEYIHKKEKKSLNSSSSMPVSETKDQKDFISNPSRVQTSTTWNID